MKKIYPVIPTWRREERLSETLKILTSLEGTEPARVLHQTDPMGSSAARAEICKEVAGHAGEGHLILMLDDDLRGDLSGTDIRWAAEHFDCDPLLHIVQLVNSSSAPKDKIQYLPYAYHCFLIRTDLILSGINYGPDAYADEVNLSLKTWLSGWRVGRTARARIQHHVTPRGGSASFGGGREEAYKSGAVEIASVFVKKFVEPGYVETDLSHRDGVPLPKNYRDISITSKGLKKHRAERDRIIENKSISDPLSDRRYKYK